MAHLLFVFEGAGVHLRPPGAESRSERGGTGGEHPAAELQDPETGEPPEEVQGLQVRGHTLTEGGSVKYRELNLIIVTQYLSMASFQYSH